MITKEEVLKLNPTKDHDRKIIAQFFHNFFFAIPEDKWCVGHFKLSWFVSSPNAYGYVTRYCASGHVMEKLDSSVSRAKAHPLAELLTSIAPRVVSVNDHELNGVTTAPTPRQRILEYLNKIIDGEL